jgi:multidrug efflux pump
MNNLIDAALNRSRTVLMLFSLIMIIGIVTMITIPKESNPDIQVPIVYVSVGHEGISPEDADRLIYKPLETELKSVDGLKEMISTASQGHLSVMLEFYGDIDIDQALIDVRERVDTAKKELPRDSDEPSIKEINVALFPVMIVTLSGDVDESLLYASANRLQEVIETLPGVLSADLVGKREELAEIIVDPARMDNYNLSFSQLATLVSNNNQLVAAGDLDTGAGRFSVKVPGLIEDVNDILNMPVKVVGDDVVKFRDIAVGRLAYKDRRDIARINGKSAVVLEIKKRIGSNIIETLGQVKYIIEQAEEQLPAGIEISYSQDESNNIKNMLNDLFNNVLVATILVMIIVVGSLGLRSATMVGLAIPGSFLIGILLLDAMGYTLNMVVLFSLILSVGMLVDGAIVVTEYADRRMAEGASKFHAYSEAAKRMAWPIIASTATTLAVFFPLLFWPGTTGDFMMFLPLTLLFTLSASLVMALIVVPTIGTVIGKSGDHNADSLATMRAAESGNFDDIPGFTGRYIHYLKLALERPRQIFMGAITALFLTLIVYGQLGHGVEFFPDVDSDIGLVDIRARGNLSLAERDDLVAQVERKIFDMAEVESIYTSTFVKAPNNSAPDLIGRIQIELADWEHRRLADEILKDIEIRTRELAGIIVETQKKAGGPAAGADIQLQITSDSAPDLIKAIGIANKIFHKDPELKDIRDDLPLDGISWELEIDRENASRYGADIATTGSMIRMVTGGLKVGSFRPDYTDGEVDISLRYPAENRTIDQFDGINISTSAGLTPISNFMERKAVQQVSNLIRIDGKRRYRILANVTEDVNSTAKIEQLSALLKEEQWADGIEMKFRGDFEKMGETGSFLVKAFFIAIFLMLTILVTQFNSFYHAGLILSAIVLSIAGVLIGLLLLGEPFGVVMSGMGVIALAGIVVNNNIVLIDTFNQLIKEGVPAIDAALRTGAQRLRPVLLTAVTTVLGLIPMVFQWNIDLIHNHVTAGAPSSQWWTQLSTAIAGGLTFATILTLVLTPCLLVIGEQKKEKQLAKNKEKQRVKQRAIADKAGV